MNVSSLVSKIKPKKGASSIRHITVAKVITLYKKDSRDNPTNYHPISLLSLFNNVNQKNYVQMSIQFS